MHHPESSSLFEVFNEEEFGHLFEGSEGGNLVDVTGIKWAEAQFKNQEK